MPHSNPPLRRRRAALALVFAALAAVPLGCAPRASNESGNAVVDPSAAPQTGPNAAAGVSQPNPDILRQYPAPQGVPSLDAAETAATAKPDDPRAALNLGLALYDAGDVVRAAKQLEKALTLTPTDVTALRYLGYANLAANNADAALAAFRRLADLNSAPVATRAAAHGVAGDLLWGEGKLDDAAEEFEAALKLDKKQGRALLALGVYAAQKGDRATARKRLEAAAGVLPAGAPRASAFALLGRLAAEGGDKKAALAAFDRALKDDPKNEYASAARAKLAGGGGATEEGGKKG